MNIDLLIEIMNLIGDVAFAVSGAMTAIEKRMDIFGVCVLSIVTTVGGGMTRDVLFGILPPIALQDPLDIGVATVVACIVFIWAARKKHLDQSQSPITANMLNISDAIGLGIFTVIGINVAQSHLEDAHAFILIVVGVITGVGGGALRDVLSGSIPYIFKKHVYAMASAVGAIAYVVMDDLVGVAWATILCAILVIAIRLLASYYRWNLPRIHEIEEEIGSNTEP